MTRSVVLTGASKGIGYGMADALLARGCRVTFCARGESGVRAAVERLSAKHGADRIAAQPCDVSAYDDVRALAALAVERFGPIERWVNNAGASNPQTPFAAQKPETLAGVVRSNLLGTMNGTHVALAHMLPRRAGAIFNMEGYGAGGERMLGMAPYGSTKTAIRYLTKSIAEEVKDGGVQVCALSPGVVTTDHLREVYEQGDAAHWARAQWLFRFIADPPEVVCPWLADAVLADHANGARVAWMTVPKAVWRFLQPRYHRRKLFE